MRRLFRRILANFAALCLAANAAASTRFVDLNSTNPVPPYTSWETAATNIQDATSIAGVGDTVLVTNGVYQYGGDSLNGSNRVDIPINVTLQSMNGPGVTTIKGYQVPGTTNGASAVRCVYIHQSGKLFGFTVTGGATASSGGVSTESGGGINTETSCVISNCIVSGNTSAVYGGGAYLGANTTLFNCIIAGNTVFSGSGGGAYSIPAGPSAPMLVNCVISNNAAGTSGAGVGFCTVNSSLLVGNKGDPAYGGTFNNCTITANFGKANGSTLNNSIIYYNFSGFYADCYQCNLTNCCTTIGPGTLSLANNSFSNAPGFVNPSAGDYHLNPWSHCIDAGNNAQATNSIDLDGNPRIAGAAVDLGAYEAQSSFQGVAHYVSLHSTNPVPPYASWSTAATNLQDGVGAAQPGEYVIADDGVYTNSGTVMFGAETNRVAVTTGVTLASAGGPQAAIILGSSQTRCAYISSNSTLMGFTLTGGHGRASGGDTTNEQSGLGAWCEIGGTISNCVVFGNWMLGGGPLGGGIFRGSVYNTIISSNSASLGAGAAFGNYFNCYFVSNGVGSSGYGGGIYRGIASNCTFVANGLFYGTIGGGAYQSTLYNCTLTTNSGTYGGGGADSSTLYGCTLIGNQSATGGGGSRLSTNYNCAFLNNYGSSGGAVSGGFCSGCFLSNNVGQNGGGSYQTVLTNCVIAANRATNASSGGGANQGTLFNCLIVSNSAIDGGGVYLGTLYNCTIVGNTATNGGGTFSGQIYNSIVYYNSAPTGSNYGGGNLFSCCTFPIGIGTSSCFTNPPLLVDLAGGNLRLQSNSPCINSGNNNYITNAVKLAIDFDGNPRIISSAVDVGAYEFPSPASMLPYTWLLQYGFATDGSADGADADGDGMSNYAEWRAKTIPTDPSSVLAVQPPVVTDTNATITWPSVFGITYYVQSTPDLFAQPFESIASNIVGAAGTTSYIDTNAVGSVSLFYRVGVQ